METDEHGVLTLVELERVVRRWAKIERERYVSLWREILTLVARAQHDQDVAVGEGGTQKRLSETDTPA